MAGRWTAKSRIALGLVGLVVSMVLMAGLLGLIPDRTGAIRDGRAALAETMAASATVLESGSQLQKARAILALAVERNDDLQFGSATPAGWSAGRFNRSARRRLAAVAG